MKLKIISNAMVTAGLALLLAGPLAAFATNSGHIVSLNMTGASGPGDCIEIDSRVQADEPLPPSNLYYQLFAPGGARIAIRQINLPAMDTGATDSDSWSYCNPPSRGTYTVSLCWSTGTGDGQGHGNTNGNISCGETQATSVPTMGWFLGAGSLALLAGFLYRRRRDFVTDPR